MGLILYQRDDCHLCDLALDVLAVARVPEFESVFIDGDAGLEDRYGVRVPVLRETASSLLKFSRARACFQALCLRYRPQP